MLSIMTMGIVATLVNMFGQVKDGDVPTDAIFGGFIVTTMLMIGGTTRAREVAKMLMLAFMITSFAVNGTELFGVISRVANGDKLNQVLNNGDE